MVDRIFFALLFLLYIHIAIVDYSKAIFLFLRKFKVIQKLNFLKHLKPINPTKLSQTKIV